MISFLKQNFILIFILILGVGFRLLFMFTQPFDSDMAFVGIMAKHILEGEFPLLYYGDTYGSSFGGYIVAPFFALFGMSLNVLRLSFIFFPFLFILTTYFLGKMIHSKPVGLIAALMVALSPYLVTCYNIQMQNGYVETFVVGNLIFILTCLLLRERQSPLKWKQMGLLGLLYGLGYAYHPQSVYYIATSALFLFFFRRRDLFSKKIIVLILGASLGSLCILSWNLAHGFPFLKFTQTYEQHETRLLQEVMKLFTERLPIVLGALHPNSKQWILPAISAAALLIFLAAVLFVFFERFKSWLQRREFHLVDLLLVYLVILPVIFFASDFYKAPTQRYLIYLYPALALVLALFLERVRKKAPAACALMLGVVLVNATASNIRSDIFPSPERRQELQEEKSQIRQLGDFLSQNRMFYNYAADYWDGAKISFLLGEKIVLGAPFADRYPLWTLRADAFNAPAFVLRGSDAEIFVESMKFIGGSYREEKIGLWKIFYGFQPPARDFIELEPEGWKVTTNAETSRIAAVVDRKIQTRWKTSQPGAALQVDLGRPREIRKIILLMGRKGVRTPRAFEVKVSLDGKNWKTAATCRAYQTPLFWSGPHPFWKQRDGRLEILVEPAPARYLRIQNTQEPLDGPWGVSELMLYEKSARSATPSYSLDDVISFLRANRIKKLVADFWESAALAEKTKGEIQTLTEDYRLAGATDYFVNGYDGTFPYFNSMSRRVKLDAKSAVLLLQDQLPQVRKKLAQQRYDFQEKSFGDRVLLYDFQRREAQGQRLSRANWETQAKAAVDGFSFTKYEMKLNPENPVYLEIDLKKQESFQKLEFLFSRALRNETLQGTLQVSSDGKRWREVPLEADGDLYWTGVNLIDVEQDRVAYRFSPQEARFVKIGLQSVYEKTRVKIKEMYLYE